ncbi:probable transcription factor At1g61730 [Cornus florida]|uniref:probable transcription factor At1g61730 n=1 Tax=Cornus florida TaxID=4283 RepID=UPI0028A0CC4F|nr:probable transcription factor At1g61730 [Cornus florida]
MDFKSPPMSLPVDKRSTAVQKSNPTSRTDEAFHSESESEFESDYPSSKPLPKSAVKHPAETEQNEILEPQRKKKKVDNGHQENGFVEEKIYVFSRFWSEEDEIAILKGMIEYKSSKGDYPYTDMGAFHDFIKKSLYINPSRKQLTDKISRFE